MADRLQFRGYPSYEIPSEPIADREIIFDLTKDTLVVGQNKTYVLTEGTGYTRTQVDQLLEGFEGGGGGVGPQGPPGPEGPPGADGTGFVLKGSIAPETGPPSFDGESAGDIYMDTVGDGWAWDGVSWSNVGPIQGPQGEQGDPGTIPGDVTAFGAVGDGVTDDTAAIQAALNSNFKHIYFPVGSYRIRQQLTVYKTIGNSTSGGNGDVTPALYSNVNGRTFSGPGKITASNNVDDCFLIQASDNIITLNCDGNQKISGFLRIEGADNVITGCSIKDLYRSKTDPCEVYGIWHRTITDSSLKISDNVIDNLESLGDATGSPPVPNANGRGMARAIKIESRLPKPGITKQNLINNNVINNILGEEGDAIVVVARTTGTSSGKFTHSGALISNNTINNYSRRALKIQAWGATVVNNVITQPGDYQPSNSEQAVIDFVQGGDHVCSNNVLDGNIHRSQIKVLATGADSTSNETVNNISIIGNTIRGIGKETSDVKQPQFNTPAVTNLIYVQTGNGTGVVISNNIVMAQTFEQTAIATRQNINQHVTGNHCVTADRRITYDVALDPESTFSGNSCGRPWVTFGGQRQSNSGSNSRSDYSMFIDTAEDLEHSLVLYNSEDTGGDENIGSQIQFGNGDYANANSSTGTYKDGITSSIRAVYQGSIGKSSLDIMTGADDFHTRFESTGSLLLGDPGADNYDDVKFGYLADKDTFVCPSRSSTAAPQNAQKGWIFFDINNNTLRVWNGTRWMFVTMTTSI